MTLRKTLYLDGRSRLCVQRVGPALEVTREGQAPAWYPLPRLSAIVCRGPVAWQGDALQACVMHGLAVVFLDLDDRCVGMASGLPPERLNLGSRLELAAAHPDWEQRYRTWLHSQHHRRAHYACQALGWPDQRDLRRLRQALHQALLTRMSTDAEPTLQHLTNLLRVDVATELAQAGLSPEQLTGLGPAGHLLDDLLSLLQWPLRGRLLAVPQITAMPVLREAASAYHHHLQPGLLATCRRIVATLWSLGP
jgi:hypothetical protein